jgi:hypothetical protein
MQCQARNQKETERLFISEASLVFMIELIKLPAHAG